MANGQNNITDWGGNIVKHELCDSLELRITIGELCFNVLVFPISRSCARKKNFKSILYGGPLSFLINESYLQHSLLRIQSPFHLAHLATLIFEKIFCKEKPVSGVSLHVNIFSLLLLSRHLLSVMWSAAGIIPKMRWSCLALHAFSSS